MKLHLLYTAVWMLGLSLTKEKKRLSDILFGSLFSAVLQIMYRTFPIRAYADRENTAQLPTERIRQKQRCRKRFSAACGIKSFNSLSWRSGFGGIKGEKERFVFERFFVGTERRKPLFALLLIYTAKNGKTWQKNCLFYKKFTSYVPQQAKITGL